MKSSCCFGLRCLAAALAVCALPFAKPNASAQDADAKAAEPAKAPSPVRFDPVLREVEGWRIHIDPALVEGEHREAGAKALAMLANHLQRIKILVPPEPLGMPGLSWMPLPGWP